ncbi:hypothetical protein [Periweissella fabalis]|uniref:Mga helix-turn-helix domain-containing protein n=1 Tax=Periweissella fabalis TaxID=1070421 RepID=A0A7X6N2V2_9LACO|nr:hypothetical protein [Periweissella fabalis]MCM0598188.1 hypothetical protein [Periweissella fabalis]NKZ24688.1 hypothetical protein [Periweissella fabalis]
MDFLSILPEQDQLKIKILELVLSLSNDDVRNDVIREHLAISNYKFEESINGINNDTEIILQQKALTIEQNWLVVEPCVSRALIQQLRAYYFKFAPLQILIDNTLHQNRYPRAQELEVSFGWSRTYYSKQKRLLKDLQIDQWHTYAEITTRQFIFSLYTYFGYKLTIENNVEQLKIQKLVALTTKSQLSPNQQQQAELLMAIMLIRMSVPTREIITTNLWVSPSVGLVKQFSVILECDTQRATIEAQLLLQILFEQGLLVDELMTSLQIKADYNTELATIVDIITHNMQLLLQTGSQTKQQEFVKSATQIIFSELYTQGFAAEFDITRTRYFEDIYPTLNRLVNKVIKALLEQHVLTEQYQIDRIYFKLMSYILVSDFDISQFDQIEVCFDFSGGQYVNQFMIETFKTYININVVISTHVTKTTDIYLGDYFNDQLLIEQLIWVKPPTAMDWAKLGDMIAQAKISKYRHVKEE